MHIPDPQAIPKPPIPNTIIPYKVKKFFVY